MDEIHITPINDTWEHQDNRQCWCQPYTRADQPNIWIHNSNDKRELYENGQRKPT